MALEAIAPLKFLLDLLQPLLTDAAKERLKPLSSQQTARKRAFDLYQQVERVSFSSHEFARALGIFVNAAALAEESPADLMEAKAPLLDSIDDLATEISIMTAAIERLCPQLSIHQPNVFGSLHRFREHRNRSMDVSQRRAELNAFARRDILELQQLLAEAKRNNTLIDNTLTEFRTFLASTFPFKESF